MKEGECYVEHGSVWCYGEYIEGVLAARASPFQMNGRLEFARRCEGEGCTARLAELTVENGHLR